ncbi:hypothetical protein GP486_005335 [Trichoglossum hirsutum]|uniref:Radical SAM core domain-containing protein n=1 Tax=Trichoglossum hirsutum TaxID=265104 RepID=A0A9P8L9D8_9PEZI|nr:hypothetical protein GP486_005335 [Trichoglossum hirsutum]
MARFTLHSASALLRPRTNLALNCGKIRVRRGVDTHGRGLFSAAVTIPESTPADAPREIPGVLPQTPPQVASVVDRKEAIRHSKPFSSFLTDNFQRQHDYLRISVTERCNLRCLYCMPEEGVPLSPPAHLLTTPEIFYLSSLFVSQGVSKIRLTGGEPTVRRDILPLMNSLGSLRSSGLRELCITTNGISLHRKLDSMVDAGLTGINLSLDTLDPFQFQIMTRRNGFEAVMKSVDRILEMIKLGANIKLKINCVVMRGLNDQDIISFVEMGRENLVEVRFIEYMPFDGNKWSKAKMMSYGEMLDIIRGKYPILRKVKDHKNDTSKTYEVPGFVGRVGFITSMTHNFCGTCNRLRITSDGNLKVCLFGNAEVSLRDILRKSNGGKPIDEEAFEAMKEIEMGRQQGSPSAKGLLGYGERERELLEVIGMAVRRKKAKHAGMGILENMKNRPMILIGERAPLPTSTRRSHTLPTTLGIPAQLLHGRLPLSLFAARDFSTKSRSSEDELTHVTPSGKAHMVPISPKQITSRIAIAQGRILFSNPAPARLIAQNALKKGDVLAVARIAGIMAAKRTSELVPLCHPIGLESVSLDLRILTPGEEEEGKRLSGSEGSFGSVGIQAVVRCEGKTGVEMEALTAVSVAALTVYDMCKSVDRGMRIDAVRVVLKKGGKSGVWVEDGFVDPEETEQ